MFSISCLYDFKTAIDVKPEVHYRSPVAELHQTTQIKLSESMDNNTQNVNKLRPYSCTECNKTFIQKHHMIAHRKVHSGIRPHICDHCGKSFIHKHSLNTHNLLHSNDRPYHCVICNKNFTLKHHLSSHIKIHNRDNSFVCEECGRAFPLKRHLVTHAKFHSGERPFSCVECGESFSQKKHLVTHYRFHGSINTFACGECDAKFTRKFELDNHSRLHGQKMMTCPICLKEFLQKRTLVAHMKNHTTKPPSFDVQHAEGRDDAKWVNLQNVDFGTSVISKLHACEFCSKSFRAKHGLQQHTKRHPEGSCRMKSYICEECNKTFYQKNHLLLHQRHHSKHQLTVGSLLPNDV